MIRVQVTEQKRQGEEAFKKFDMPHYTKSLFGMYGGKEIKVSLQARNELVGILIDRFGKDIMISPVGADRFQTTVHVALSKQFLGWIMSLGDGIQITAPDTVVTQMKEEIKRLYAQYQCK